MQEIENEPAPQLLIGAHLLTIGLMVPASVGDGRLVDPVEDLPGQPQRDQVGFGQCDQLVDQRPDRAPPRLVHVLQRDPLGRAQRPVVDQRGAVRRAERTPFADGLDEDVNGTGRHVLHRGPLDRCVRIEPAGDLGRDPVRDLSTPGQHGRGHFRTGLGHGGPSSPRHCLELGIRHRRMCSNLGARHMV
ncbi:hypothetical protein [Tsukamurella sp. PLM1]|uniref:hypothetical protein n=1 Tax=Tsukamurella sp. PLM1 TaxID=2929795 RepID=UPI0020C17386|nr:hypothetical protein [Tsukamurella sp. PLM1]